MKIMKVKFREIIKYILLSVFSLLLILSTLKFHFIFSTLWGIIVWFILRWIKTKKTQKLLSKIHPLDVLKKIFEQPVPIIITVISILIFLFLYNPLQVDTSSMNFNCKYSNQTKNINCTSNIVLQNLMPVFGKITNIDGKIDNKYVDLFPDSKVIIYTYPEDNTNKTDIFFLPLLQPDESTAVEIKFSLKIYNGMTFVKNIPIYISYNLKFPFHKELKKYITSSLTLPQFTYDPKTQVRVLQGYTVSWCNAPDIICKIYYEIANLSKFVDQNLT